MIMNKKNVKDLETGRAHWLGVLRKMDAGEESPGWSGDRASLVMTIQKFEEDLGLGEYTTGKQTPWTKPRRIVYGEPDIDFEVVVKEVEPTKEELEMTGGRDCYTREEEEKHYGGIGRWIEVVAVLKEPTALIDEEEDDFQAPVFYEVAQQFAVVGERWYLSNDSVIDNGEVTCQVVVKLT